MIQEFLHSQKNKLHFRNIYCTCRSYSAYPLQVCGKSRSWPTIYQDWIKLILIIQLCLAFKYRIQQRNSRHQLLPQCHQPTTWRTWQNLTSSLILPTGANYAKTWHHPQNQKCTAYGTIIRGGPSQGHSYHTHKILWCLYIWFLRYVGG